jgi:hypothetical protein
MLTAREDTGVSRPGGREVDDDEAEREATEDGPDERDKLPLADLPTAIRRFGTDLLCRWNLGCMGSDADADAERARVGGNEDKGLEVDFLRGLAIRSALTPYDPYLDSVLARTPIGQRTE